ncbi:TetR family transcriptional regulator [Rhodoglobus vestalii]|uniref:TetR family transcriptional regulator n=2 Tax=Rhodoglobus vestalii TaxID=193384 RepID=A0A8H2K7X5_9MICO|nr:TetR family transcriptional regulator [Rhodoglobus vestalii]
MVFGENYFSNSCRKTHGFLAHICHNQRMDERVERTRRSLQQALFALTQERPLDEVTVGDIVERAGVNRSSFYQHFADKETLLAFAIESAADDAGVELVNLDPQSTEPPPAITSYLRHINANAAVYASALGPRGSALVSSRLHARLNLIVRNGILSIGNHPFEGLPVEIATASITGSTYGIIVEWLGMVPRPPAETAVAWIWQSFGTPSGRWGEPEDTA